MIKNICTEDLKNGLSETLEALKKGEVEAQHGQRQLFYNPNRIRWEVWQVKDIQKPKIVLETICIKSAIDQLFNEKVPQ